MRTNKNKAPYYFSFKRWDNNQIMPATIYVSGQTVTSGAIRLMIELDLVKVKLNCNSNISSLN